MSFDVAEIRMVFVCEQRIERVRSRFRSLISQGYERVSPDELGNLALELLVTERMLKKALEVAISEEEKKRICELLSIIEDLKEYVVRLYTMISMGRRRRREVRWRR